MSSIFSEASNDRYVKEFQNGAISKHTYYHPNWSVSELIDQKNGRSISVVLPALNEEKTVARVIESIKPLEGNLVDEIIVIDSGSNDRTIEIARSAGAKVFTREEALPGYEPWFGKGEVLWRSLAVAKGDIIAFVDSDLVNPSPNFVPLLIGQLLLHEELELVKAFYKRPLISDNKSSNSGGGRVTELLVRPLLAALKPELTTIIQPLSGEYAASRKLLQSLPFAPGYGVEIGILIDTFNKYGMDVIGQVNLGVRSHRNRPIDQLSGMSRQVITTLFDRCGIKDSMFPLLQFELNEGEINVNAIGVSDADRPPMKQILGK